MQRFTRLHVQESDDCHFVPLTIDDHQCIGLFDSGSQLCGITKSLLDTFNSKPEIEKTDKNIISVNNASSPCEGIVHLKIKLNNFEAIVPFYLLDREDKYLILGINFQKAFGLIYDPCNDRLTFQNGERVTLIKESRENGKAMAVSHAGIAFEKCKETCTSYHNKEELDPRTGTRSTMFRAVKTLTTQTNTHVREVPIWNESSRPFLIKKGLILESHHEGIQEVNSTPGVDCYVTESTTVNALCMSRQHCDVQEGAKTAQQQQSERDGKSFSGGSGCDRCYRAPGARYACSSFGHHRSLPFTRLRLRPLTFHLA